MEIERARKINAALCQLVLHSTGIIKDYKAIEQEVEFIKEMELVDLLEATAIIQKQNRDLEKEKDPEKKKGTMLHCADRMLAAIYTCLNYPLQSGDEVEPIVTIGVRNLVNYRVLRDEQG